MVVRHLHDDEEHGQYAEEHEDRVAPGVAPGGGARRSGGGVDRRHDDVVRARRPAARTATPPAMTMYKPAPTLARTSPVGMPNCCSMSLAFDPTLAMCTSAITNVTPPEINSATFNHRSRRPSSNPTPAMAATTAATTIVRPSPPFQPVSAPPGGLTKATAVGSNTVMRSHTWNAPIAPSPAPTSAAIAAGRLSIRIAAGGSGSGGGAGDCGLGLSGGGVSRSTVVGGSGAPQPAQNNASVSFTGRWHVGHTTAGNPANLSPPRRSLAGRCSP